MNYRHAFHAGNHADVLKHAALALVLERLKAKEKPFSVLDTHAGRGVYDLESEEAGRSGEHRGGVSRVLDDSSPPPRLLPYIEAVKRQNPFGGMRWYPGSPAIICDALRPGDNAKFCELHPEERAALTAAIGADARVKIYERDGYEAVRAFLPPTPRRGLVLIDPPFEEKGEYERLAAAVADGVKRWATGVFMIWRPVKDESPFRAFLQTVGALQLQRTLSVELRIAPAAEGRLTGSGLFVVNPPFGLGDALASVLPYLARRLALAPGGGWTLFETERGAILRDLGGGA